MRVRPLHFAIFSVLALLAIFWLPTRVPVPPAGSVSYLFGFNNHVAMLALLLTIVTGAIWTRGLSLQPLESDGTEDISKRPLWIALAVTLVLCVLLSVLYQGVSEAVYMINRSLRLAAGERPYIDFEFIYGPLLIYPQVWIARLLSISVVSAYYIYWILNWLVGVCEIYWIIEWLGFQRRHRNQIFYMLLLCYSCALPSTGLNYTPLRGMSALFCILATDRLVAQQKRFVYFAALGMAAVLFSISAESGIAYAVTASVYMGLQLRHRLRDRYAIAGYLMSLCGFAGIYMLASRMHVMDTLRMFSGGVEYLPLMLTPVVLLILIGIFIAGCYAWSCLLHGRWQDSRLAAVLLAGALLPGALGRCDPGHIMGYEMGAVLTSLVLASYRERVWRWAAVAFFLFAFAAPAVSTLWSSRHDLHTAAVRIVFGGNRGQSAPSRWLAAEIVKHRGQGALLRQTGRITPIVTEPSELYQHATTIVDAPINFNGPQFYYSPHVDQGYFFPNIDLLDDVETKRKIAELQEHPERDLMILDKTNLQSDCAPNPASVQDLLRGVFGYSYFHHAKNAPAGMLPLCQYILQHYRYSQAPSDPNSHYALWEPIAAGQ